MNINKEDIKLRPITLSDSIDRHEYFLKLAEAKVGVVHSVFEIGQNHLGTLDKIRDFLIYKRGLWFVATHKDKIIGEIDITLFDAQKLAHNGKLTIGILPDSQSLGIGSLLMNNALIWARRNNILRIELSVMARNKKARDFYKKFGFIEEGIKKNYFKHDDGTYEDDILMALWL